MQRFASLYAALDASTSTDAKVAALQAYLREAEPADAAWGVYLLAGGKPRQTIPTAVLRAQAMLAAGLPEWLFEASYQAVGDLAETIAHILPPPSSHSRLGLADWMTQRLLPLRGAQPAQQAQALQAWWAELAADERFLLTKLIGGGLRVGVSRGLVQRALARHAGLDAQLVAQRMMGYTDARHQPDAAALQALLMPAGAAPLQAGGQPYPFYLAHALGGPDQEVSVADRLGDATQWQAEWKYDGVRAQLVRRAGQVWLWSRGEDLMNGRFPEVEQAAMALPDGTVLDGELLVWPAGQAAPAPFALLQTRLQRKTLGKKLLADAPVVFVAYDLLEQLGQDQRALPQQQRRWQLQDLLALPALTAVMAARALFCAPLLKAQDWPDLAAWRAQARALGMEGLMLKHRQAPYGTGRTKAAGLSQGGWWKWKLDALQVDGVLIYAQAGHGRRAGLYTDYTFAVWSRAPHDVAEAQAVVDAISRREPAVPGALQLVAFAKAYSGLSDDEMRQVDRLIRDSTLEKFGPVRSVRPSLVVTLGFEGIQRSKRHKSGVALRFPRILRLRPDKPLQEADTLASLAALLPEPARSALGTDRHGAA